ncbi:MAG TPA: tripartite tricarboxylate transporter TctB family protein [Albitalea sp.]|nr:tripartite tricarboxylate transporter TctB family protein [Albitalea sp.]
MHWLRRFNKDRTGAALLILLGVGVAVRGSSYRVGDLTHMGAGFMPVVYGVLLAAIGVVLGLTARDEPDAKGASAQWRGWLCIIGGVFAFVVFGHWGGLVPATFASVFIAALGDRQNTVRDAALLALAMVAAGYLIFSVGLHLQLAPFTWG